MEGFADAEAGGKERGWGAEASAMEEDEEREDSQVGAAGEGADVFEFGVEAVDTKAAYCVVQEEGGIKGEGEFEAGGGADFVDQRGGEPHVFGGEGEVEFLGQLGGGAEAK